MPIRKLANRPLSIHAAANGSIEDSNRYKAQFEKPSEKDRAGKLVEELWDTLEKKYLVDGHSLDDNAEFLAVRGKIDQLGVMVEQLYDICGELEDELYGA